MFSRSSVGPQSHGPWYTGTMPSQDNDDLLSGSIDDLVDNVFACTPQCGNLTLRTNVKGGGVSDWDEDEMLVSKKKSLQHSA